MSKGNDYENDILNLILNGIPIANLADDASVGPLTELWVSLCTADPGDGGNQGTNEVTYTGYARVSVPRDPVTPFWTVADGVANPSTTIDFPEVDAGTETATHFIVGTDETGAGKVLYIGTITPNIAIAVAGVPQLTEETAIEED